MQEDLRYPIGEYIQQPYSEKLKDEWITDIKFCPNGIEAAIREIETGAHKEVIDDCSVVAQRELRLN